MTPVLSVHARQRCEEMGIRTKRVKRVVREPDLSYAAHSGRIVVCRNDEPEFRVVVVADDRLLVVTVIPWSYETYSRA